MPRIKYPISQAERDYNKRYEDLVQMEYVAKIRNSPKFHQNADEYKLRFIRNIHGLLNRGFDLNEKQADFLADLYSKYTD